GGCGTCFAPMFQNSYLNVAICNGARGDLACFLNARLQYREMSERPNILFIEDDPEIRQLVQDYLQRQGLRVRTGDGGAALDRHRTVYGDPDLIVLDI